MIWIIVGLPLQNGPSQSVPVIGNARQQVKDEVQVLPKTVIEKNSSEIYLIKTEVMDERKSTIRKSASNSLER